MLLSGFISHWFNKYVVLYLSWDDRKRLWVNRLETLLKLVQKIPADSGTSSTLMTLPKAPTLLK